MRTLWHDLVYAARLLRKSPGFSFIAIVTMALGIGANSAIFSVINGVLLKPLEYPHAERLVFITSRFPTLGFEQFWVDPVEYVELRQNVRAFETIGAYTTDAVNLGTPQQPRRVRTATVTAELFDALAVPARIGRRIDAPDNLPGSAPVVVLSHELWASAFASDTGILGRAVQVDGQSRTVVGVMPPGFDVHDERVEAWLPLSISPANPGNRGNHYLYLVGRLTPGTSYGAARAEVDTLVANWPTAAAKRHTPNTKNHPLRLDPLQDDIVGSARTALWVLQGAVFFILLIACANLANLLLARAETRQREFAVRTALGASRRRVVRQFATEGVLIATLGAVAGLGLAQAGVRLLVAISPESLPRAADLGLDWRVVLFTLAAGIGTGIVFGLAPALHYSNHALHASLKDGGTRSTGGSASNRLRRALVPLEVALAVVLVVGAGLMIRSFANLLTVDAGFERSRLATFGLVLPSASYPKGEAKTGLFARLLDELRNAPGVEGVAAMTGLPPQREVNANDTDIEGYVFVPGKAPANVDYYQVVTAGYFETMRIPLREGRAFLPSDAQGPAVAIVNEALVRTFYEGHSPIGRRIRPSDGPDGKGAWYTIVGVAKDVKQGGIDAKVGSELYFNYEQLPRVDTFTPGDMNVVVRSTMPKGNLATLARDLVSRTDATLPIVKLRSMDEVFRDAVARPRFLTWLLALFGLVALALAAIGTYGVLAFLVSERRREMGVRLALGATRGNVLGLVLAQGLGLAGVGIVAGVLASIALTRLMQSLLFNVTPTDPLTLGAVVAAIVLVSAAACYVPARRATKVDPISVLRAD